MEKLMSKLYLRVSSDWMLLFQPKDQPMYITNASRTPIQFRYYDNEVLLTRKISHTFTLGGVIGQAKIPADKYCYCRAMPLILADGTYAEDDVTKDPETGNILVPEGVVLLSDTIKMENELSLLEQNLNTLTVDVMHLSARVTENNLNDVYHKLDYTLFLRRFLKHAQKAHYTESHLQSQILDLKLSLYGAESLIDELKKQQSLNTAILEKLDPDEIGAGKYDEMDKRVVELTNQVTELLSEVNALTKRIDEGTIGDSASQKEVDDLSKELKLLHKHFTEVNNGMITLAGESSIGEIERTYQHLLPTISDDMKPVVTAIRDALTHIASNTELADSAVTEGETVILTPDNLYDMLSKN